MIEVVSVPKIAHRLSRRAMWLWTIVFLVIISLPSLWREMAGPDRVTPQLNEIVIQNSEPLAQRLRSLEKTIDEAKWMQPWRQQLQHGLYQLFREGNRKVFVHSDGRLLYRPGLRALTGPGPMKHEALSVAKDPAIRQALLPVEAILDFQNQLHERGIALKLVPVPDKAAWTMQSFVRHPEAAPFYDRLKAAGIEVLTLEFSQLANPFLRSDTHWTPQALLSAATQIAGGDTPPTFVTAAQITGPGDLMQKLDLNSEKAVESVFPLRFTQGQIDDSATTVLLADSFANCYADQGLPFYSHREAGFPKALSAALGVPIQVIAINGGGASAVRERFASLPDDTVRKKKEVIWLLAERDLLLSGSAAAEAGVEWKKVAFSPHRSASKPSETLTTTQPIRLKATITELSNKQAPGLYPSALYTALAKVDQVMEGTYVENEVVLVLWNYRDHQPQPSATWQKGMTLELTAGDFFATHPELVPVNLEILESADPALPLMFVEEYKLR